MLVIQHGLNPLHVYCRLVERGLNKTLSMSICRHYEMLVYGWLVWFTTFVINTCRLCSPQELSWLNLQRAKALKDMAVLVTVAFLFSFSVAGLTYVLLNWIL
jgi:hypothetical protein